ncbi:MAG: FAD-dependent oxidoreductase [Thermoplasmata archaeon]
MQIKIAVIGGGISGLFSAFYLAQSGMNVTLFERGDLSSGTSGKFHGMLHSGARYAVNDRISAIECISENRRLSSIAGNFIDDTGGFFVAANENEAEFGDRLMKGCADAGIDAREEDPEALTAREKYLGKIKRSISVPDKIVRSYEFSVAIAARSVIDGLNVKTYSNVKKIKVNEEEAYAIEYEKAGKVYEDKFDYIVNATGPFSNEILAASGLDQEEMVPSAGAMVVYEGRLVNSIINRMREPSDGDIILPYGSVSIVGTTAVMVEDPDNFSVSDEDIEMMVDDASAVIPYIKNHKYKRIYYSTRPLSEDTSEDSRKASRSFKIVKNSKARNILTVTGGKFTTGRLIGESVAKMISSETGDKVNLKDYDFNYAYSDYMSKVKNDIPAMDKINERNGTIDEEFAQRAISFLISHSISRGDKIGF